MAHATCSVGDCQRNAHARGMCTLHYRRWWDGHKYNTNPPTQEERFWVKVEKTETCWLWTGALVHGYGAFQVGTKARTRNVRAHRFAYELLVGPIPDGLSLDHLCRNRACVNPAHLEPVTTRENILRGAGLAAANATRTHCPQGHEYNEENTKYDKRGRRACRPCQNERNRIRYWAAKNGATG